MSAPNVLTFPAQPVDLRRDPQSGYYIPEDHHYDGWSEAEIDRKLQREGFFWATRIGGLSPGAIKRALKLGRLLAYYELVRAADMDCR